MPYYEKPILTRENSELLLYINFSEKERAKTVGSYRWDPDRKCWVYPATRRIYDALVAEFGEHLEIQFSTRPDSSTANVNDGKPVTGIQAVNIQSKPATITTIVKPNDNDDRQSMLENEVKRLRVANQTYEEQVRGLIEDARQLGLSNTSLKNEKQSLIEQRDNLRLDLDRIRQHNASSPSVESLITQLRQREAQLSQFEDVLDRNQDLLSQKDAELVAAKRKFATREAQYTDLFAEVTSMRRKLDANSSEASVQTRIKYVALEATGNNDEFAALLDKVELSELPLRIARLLESKLRDRLKISDNERPNLIDLLTQANDSEILPRDAIDLAHIIRKQRNIIVHAEDKEPNCQARSIICLFAAALLWPEFEQE